MHSLLVVATSATKSTRTSAPRLSVRSSLRFVLFFAFIDVFAFYRSHSLSDSLVCVRCV